MQIHPKRLKALRREASLSREQLEFEAGLPQMFLWRAESGDLEDPPDEMVLQLAGVLSARLGRQVAVEDFTHSLNAK